MNSITKTISHENSAGSNKSHSGSRPHTPFSAHNEKIYEQENTAGHDRNHDHEHDNDHDHEREYDRHSHFHSNFEKRKCFFEEIVNFFKTNKIYEALPVNSQIFIIDCTINIKDVVSIMLQEGMYCLLIWNSKVKEYIGLFTIRDLLRLFIFTYEKLCENKTTRFSKFSPCSKVEQTSTIFDRMSHKEIAKRIYTFHQLHNNPRRFQSDNLSAITESDNESAVSVFDQTSDEKDEKWTNIAANLPTKSLKDILNIFEFITLEEYLKLSLYENKKLPFHSLCYSNEGIDTAIETMIKVGVHRLFVELDETNKTFSGFITFELIFDYFFFNYYAKMDLIKLFKLSDFDFCKKSIYHLKTSDSVLTCLFEFEKNKISLIPIMQGEEVYGYLFLKDFIYLWNFQDEIQLTSPIKDLFDLIYDKDCANSKEPFGSDRIMIISNQENMKTVIEKMSVSSEKKLLVKENGKLKGIISLSDLFQEMFGNCD